MAQLKAEHDSLSLKLAARAHPDQQPPPAGFFEQADETQMLQFFRTNGYWMVPKAVAGPAQLARVQRAWLEATVPARHAWEVELAKGQGSDGRSSQGFASGTWVAQYYFDLPCFVEGDDRRGRPSHLHAAIFANVWRITGEIHRRA
jgi:hypothetical protein